MINNSIWQKNIYQTRLLVDILLFLHVLIIMYIISNSLARLWSLSGPKLVFQPQTSRSRYFL